jgi:hypothetical protein
MQQTHVHEQHHAGLHVAVDCQLNGLLSVQNDQVSIVDKLSVDLTTA